MNIDIPTIGAYRYRSAAKYDKGNKLEAGSQNAIVQTRAKKINGDRRQDVHKSLRQAPNTIIAVITQPSAHPFGAEKVYSADKLKGIKIFPYIKVNDFKTTR